MPAVLHDVLLGAMSLKGKFKAQRLAELLVHKTIVFSHAVTAPAGDRQNQLMQNTVRECEALLGDGD